MAGKGVNILVYLLLVLTLGCTDDGGTPADKVTTEPSLTFAMTKSLEGIIGNTQVYLFDGEGTDMGQFRQKVAGVTYGTDRLSMSVAAGTWDVMLVGANADISSRLTPPVRGEARSGKMWETQPVAGVLPSIPELRTAYVANNEVIANQHNVATETAVLARNATQVKVVIVKAGGLDISGTHQLKITNVPTTLSWEGKFLPDKDSPYVSSSPMTGNLVMHEHTDGNQYSDTLRFVIPAHKGDDYLEASPTDTTTNHLKLSVDMAMEGGARYEKANVEVPRVPRANGTLLIRISLGSEFEVSADILDWVDTELGVDLSQTWLYTDKATVGLTSSETVHVNTNASDFTVAKAADASWLTVTKNGNAIELTADVNTYNNPRTSYITVTANNVTKKIPVTQRPEEGTISVDNKRLVFCPVIHETRDIVVTSLGGDWEFVNLTSKATTGLITQGVNGDPVTFTRSSTTDFNQFDDYYGDDIVVVRNVETLDTDTIEIVNCYISIYENTINATAPTDNNQTAVTETNDVLVYGGNRNLINITPLDTWITNPSWNATNQKMTFTTARNTPSGDPRTGQMSFVHAECTDYVVTTNVFQSAVASIEPFDYFVMKVYNDGSNNNTVQLIVQFEGNSLSGVGDHPDYDKHPVGQGHDDVLSYNGGDLLKWAQGSTSNIGQNAYFNAPLFSGDVNSPWKIKLEIYIAWRDAPNPGAGVAYLRIDAFKGGTMTYVNNLWTNSDHGTVGNVFVQTYSLPTLTNSSNHANFETTYGHVATITYDRTKREATVDIH